MTFHDLSFYVWIVRGDGRLGLIDTGLPLDEASRNRLIEACKTVAPECQMSDVKTLDALLQEERIDPSDIDFVAITQPISYHTGGLVPSLLPRAQVYVSRAGVLEMLLDCPGHPPRSEYFTEDGWVFLRQLLIENRLHLVDEPTEMAPGLVFETTGGHHPGSAAVTVQTNDGLVGILETAFLQRNIDDELPIGIAENVSACREAIRRYKKTCDLVLPDHEPSLAARYGKG